VSDVALYAIGLSICIVLGGMVGAAILLVGHVRDMLRARRVRRPVPTVNTDYLMRGRRFP
jgi:hypothetical protein